MAEYDLHSVKLPYLSGFPLRLMVSLMEGPLRGLLLPSLLKNAGITSFRAMEAGGTPTFLPLAYSGRLASAEGQAAPGEWPGPPALAQAGFRFATVHDYARAYRAGETTPEEVARQVWRAVVASDETDPPLRAFIAVNEEELLAQARRATERFRRGQPLSLFDGVPVAVKDEVDMVPYPTTVGTSFLGTRPAAEDATVVARMRAAGALLIGKANMHEIGIGVTGLNPHHGTPRNPYQPGHYTGGSSSGPAAAVAAGFCPVAIGADGGGSIRIPAAFCGVVGLKPTYGRVSEHGAAPLTWSMGHLGPLAATATDAALGYGVLAGPDPKDPNTLHQPPPSLAGWDRPGLEGLVLGIYPPWFRHATAEIVAACEALLHRFEAAGAQIREVAIPDLEPARIAHLVTITLEMNRALEGTYAEHHRDHALEVRLNLALSRQFTARDYLHAQQVRSRTIAHFQRALAEADVILTPSTAVASPAIPAAALSGGESDLTTLTEIMRFALPANLTGLPAISFPAGYTTAGLPIGMQAIGRAWDEVTLLRLALAAEGLVERKAPRIHYPSL